MPVMTRGAFRKIYSPLLVPAAERRESVAPGASPGFCAVKRFSPGGQKIPVILSPHRGLKSKTTAAPGLHPGLHSGAAPRLQRAGIPCSGNSFHVILAPL